MNTSLLRHRATTLEQADVPLGHTALLLRAAAKEIDELRAASGSVIVTIPGSSPQPAEDREWEKRCHVHQTRVGWWVDCYPLSLTTKLRWTEGPLLGGSELYIWPTEAEARAALSKAPKPPDADKPQPDKEGEREISRRVFKNRYQGEPFTPQPEPKVRCFRPGSPHKWKEKRDRVRFSPGSEPVFVNKDGSVEESHEYWTPTRAELFAINGVWVECDDAPLSPQPSPAKGTEDGWLPEGMKHVGLGPTSTWPSDFTPDTMRAWVEGIHSVWRAHADALRETNERQYKTIGDLQRHNARLTAELASLRSAKPKETGEEATRRWLSDADVERLVDGTLVRVAALRCKPITHIWLRSEGRQITVDIERGDGKVLEVIRECNAGSISHCWHNNNDGKPAAWAIAPPKPPEDGKPMPWPKDLNTLVGQTRRLRSNRYGDRRVHIVTAERIIHGPYGPELEQDGIGYPIHNFELLSVDPPLAAETVEKCCHGITPKECAFCAERRQEEAVARGEDYGPLVGHLRGAEVRYAENATIRRWLDEAASAIESQARALAAFREQRAGDKPA